MFNRLVRTSASSVTSWLLNLRLLCPPPPPHAYVCTPSPPPRPTPLKSSRGMIRPMLFVPRRLSCGQLNPVPRMNRLRLLAGSPFFFACPSGITVSVTWNRVLRSLRYLCSFGVGTIGTIGTSDLSVAIICLCACRGSDYSPLFFLRASRCNKALLLVLAER